MDVIADLGQGFAVTRVWRAPASRALTSPRWRAWGRRPDSALAMQAN